MAKTKEQRLDTAMIGLAEIVEGMREAGQKITVQSLAATAGINEGLATYYIKNFLGDNTND